VSLLLYTTSEVYTNFGIESIQLSVTLMPKWLKLRGVCYSYWNIKLQTQFAEYKACWRILNLYKQKLSRLFELWHFSVYKPKNHVKSQSFYWDNRINFLGKSPLNTKASPFLSGWGGHFVVIHISLSALQRLNYPTWLALKAVTAKISAIDNGNHCTMLLAEEYWKCTATDKTVAVIFWGSYKQHRVLWTA